MQNAPQTSVPNGTEAGVRLISRTLRGRCFHMTTPSLLTQAVYRRVHVPLALVPQDRHIGELARLHHRVEQPKILVAHLRAGYDIAGDLADRIMGIERGFVVLTFRSLV